jgi:hypothetical protein
MDGDTSGDSVLAEVKACEVMKNHPHRNIAWYLGCFVKHGRIRAIAFEKYPISL